MNLKQLEAFVQVVEYKSFTKAAEVLYLTQSTISTHIATLEAICNRKLILRNNRKKIVLTLDGVRIYRYARQVLDICYKIEQEFDFPHKHSRILSLAASTVPALCILPAILADFSQQYSFCRFSLQKGDSMQVIDMVRERQSQLGFVGCYVKHHDLEFEDFCLDRLVLITPNTAFYRQMKRDKALGLNLLDQPLIIREKGSGTRKQTDAFLENKAINNLNIIAEMNDPLAICNLVASGIGVSMVSSYLAQNFAQDEKVLIFDLAEDVLYRKIYIVWNKSRGLSEMEQLFVDFSQSKVSAYNVCF